MTIDDPILRSGSEVSTVPNIPIDPAQPKRSSGFATFFKGLGGVAASFIPGMGGIVGTLLNRGGGTDFSQMQVMLREQQQSAMQMLGIQQQVSKQGQEFTTVSNLLKARHDSEMSAVNNFKS